MASEEVLFWVDVETTNLNPATSHLLQVAAIPTTLSLEPLADPLELVVSYPRLAPKLPLEAFASLEEATRAVLQEVRASRSGWAGELFAATVADCLREDSHRPAVEVLYHEADGFVQAMHSRTGLWERLSGSEALPLEEVDRRLFEFLETVAPEPRQARVAGNSVRLDLNFLEAYCPNTYRHLHYRSVDVSAFAYIFEKQVGEFQKKKTHDAVEDIRESLAEFKWLMDQVAVRPF